MRFMKRDHKSANVNFEIVKYVVDDYLMNIKKKKVNQKVQKWPGQGILKLAVKKLRFENYFEIYEPDFWDFWEKINFGTFCAQKYSQKVCVFQEYFEPPKMFLRSTLHEEDSFLHF